MSGKYIIFGATGSIGSSLAEMLSKDKSDIHLVARNQNEVEPIAEKLNCSFTVADVLKDGFIDKIKSDITEAKGIAYCIGSIDLKPLKLSKEEDFNKEVNNISEILCYQFSRVEKDISIYKSNIEKMRQALEIISLNLTSKKK